MSGLTVGIALEELKLKAADAVHSIARHLKLRSKGQLSFKTALDVAAGMTAQMFGEIYKQIDPIKIGEDARSLQIAAHYGKMLVRGSQNAMPAGVYRLLQEYPSHDCIIDRKEAEELFSRVRPLNDAEKALIAVLGEQATSAEPRNDASNLIVFNTGDDEELTDNESTNIEQGADNGLYNQGESQSGSNEVPPGDGSQAMVSRAAKKNGKKAVG